MASADNQEQPISSTESEENSDSPLSKIETIALLNDSIDRLEQTIKGISKSSAPIPSSDSINTLIATTQELADAATPVPEKTVSEPAIAEKTSPETVDQNNSEQEQELSTATKVQKKQNLPLIVIGITAIIITLVAIFWFWLPRQPAIVSSSSETLPDFALNVEDSESTRSQENLTKPSIDIPSSGERVSPEDLATDVESINSNPEAPQEVLIPDNLESPGRAKKLKLVTIEPEVDFTPEQALVAALRKKMNNLTQDYPPELIDSAQVNLPENSLLVNVTDEWYELSESRQNKLANEMLKRSRQFSFHQLELKDNTGTLVARNPVVGDQIIILQNSRK